MTQLQLSPQPSRRATLIVAISARLLRVCSAWRSPLRFGLAALLATFRLWMTVGVLCGVASWAAMAGGNTDFRLGLASAAKPSVARADSSTSVSAAAPQQALRSRAVGVGEAVGETVGETVRRLKRAGETPSALIMRASHFSTTRSSR